MRKAASSRSGGVAITAATTTTTTSMLAVTTPPTTPSTTAKTKGLREKKSVAHGHTTFLRLALDSRGKQFEQRTCRYCDTVFSFKGGTTSAALRHLKTAHLERVAHDIALCTRRSKTRSAISATAIGKPSAPALTPVAAKQPQPLQSASNHSTVPATASTDSTRVTVQPTTTATTTTATPATTSSSPAAPVDTPSTADTTSADGEALPVANSLLQHQHGSRKRTLDEVAAEPLCRPSSSDVLAPILGASTNPLTLTASQIAIAHFVRYYKDRLAPPDRLRFVRHLTHDVREAEMYNVLDPATQLELVREFASSDACVSTTM